MSERKNKNSKKMIDAFYGINSDEMTKREIQAEIETNRELNEERLLQELKENKENEKKKEMERTKRFEEDWRYIFMTTLLAMNYDKYNFVNNLR